MNNQVLHIFPYYAVIQILDNCTKSSGPFMATYYMAQNGTVYRTEQLVSSRECLLVFI